MGKNYVAGSSIQGKIKASVADKCFLKYVLVRELGEMESVKWKLLQNIRSKISKGNSLLKKIM